MCYAAQFILHGSVEIQPAWFDNVTKSVVTFCIVAVVQLPQLHTSPGSQYWVTVVDWGHDQSEDKQPHLSRCAGMSGKVLLSNTSFWTWSLSQTGGLHFGLKTPKNRVSCERVWPMWTWHVALRLELQQLKCNRANHIVKRYKRTETCCLR